MRHKAEIAWKRCLALYSPAPRIKLSEWAESNIVLPAGHSARPGRYRNWPYFREILDSIGDLSVERVTLMKSTRCGFTKGLMIAISATVANNPAPIGLLVPTDDDAKGISVDEIAPMLEANQSIGALLTEGRDSGKNTLTRKQFRNGASIKVLSARAPRNLRRHDFKFLYADEVDAMEITAEGDPLTIAERRTMAHPDRKIVVGSTPTEEEISIVERSYLESDQRVFEIGCYHCQHRFELQWEHIQWPEGEPAKASCFCPGCGAELEERRKREIVEGGRWRATKPEVERHRGYRLNALVSLLANAAWPTLAQEFLKAKRGGPAELQPFYNTVLAKPWKTSISRLTAEGLAGRAEAFGLEQGIPRECLMITAGCDVQDDRIEVSVLGWPLIGAPFALGHAIVPGSTLQRETWQELDKYLRSKWPHPAGWEIGIDAAAVDSGGSKGRTQKVYDFCNEARLSRRIFAIKGAPGPRPIWLRAQRTKDGSKLFLVGHDAAKTAVLEALARAPFLDSGKRDVDAIRVSDELSPEWFDQAAGEIRRVRYVRNRPVIEFVPKRPGQRVEALDCLVYGWAVRFSQEVRSIDLRERAAREPTPEGLPVPPTTKEKVASWAQKFNQ